MPNHGFKSTARPKLPAVHVQPTVTTELSAPASHLLVKILPGFLIHIRLQFFLQKSKQQWRTAIVTGVLVETSMKTLGDTTLRVNTLQPKVMSHHHLEKPRCGPDPPPSAASALSAPATRLPASSPSAPTAPYHRNHAGALLLPPPDPDTHWCPVGTDTCHSSQSLWRVIPCFGSKPSLVTQPVNPNPAPASRLLCLPTNHSSTLRPPDRARCPVPAPDGLARTPQKGLPAHPLPHSILRRRNEKDTHFLSS